MPIPRFVGALLASFAVALHGATIRTAPIACDGVIRAEAGEARLSAPLKGEAQLDLGAVGPWRMALESNDCWAAPVIVSGESIVIPVWPKRTVVGQFAAVPKAVAIHFASPDAAAGGVPPSETSCVVDGKRWTCGLPRVPLDLRIEVPGFAPAYLWNIDVADLGSVDLRPGASVAGFVARDDRGPLNEAVVELTAVDGTARRTKPNSRGFFQFTSLSPGTFAIAARRPNGAATRERGIRVVADRETSLRRPLLLAGFAKLRATIRPPVTPAGHPWTVVLKRVDFARHGWVPFAQSAATAAGVWERGGLERETYHVQVVDELGAVFYEREVDVDADAKELAVTVDTIPVEGRIRLGGEPIRAALTFVADDAYVLMESDDDGTFYGSLPHEGRYELRVSRKGARSESVPRRVEVRRSSSGVAALDVDLPAGRVKGVITDAHGKPLPRASVAVLRGSAYTGSALSDESGAFELAGLDPGSATLLGKYRDSSSDPYPYEIAAEPVAATIVINDARLVRGRVLSSAGGGIAGAELRYADGMFAKKTVSGPGGEFSFPLSSSDVALDIVVVTPGFPVKITKLRLPERGESADIVVSNVAGVLAIIPSPPGQWPIVFHDGCAVALVQLFQPRAAPGPPPELQNGRFVVEVEPGQYTVCPGGAAKEQCTTRVVPPRGEVLVDMRDR